MVLSRYWHVFISICKSLYMKQAFLILSFTAFSIYAPAQIQKKGAMQVQTEAPAKAEVATPDLPDPIKDVITTKYNEWKLMAAYVYNAAPEYYELQLKKGEENIVVKIDAKGNEL